MTMHVFYSSASFTVLMLCFRMGCTDIIVAPSSTEVQLGGSTYFNCSTSVTSKEVHWFHYLVSSTERSFVYGFEKFYDPYVGRFAMDKNVTSGEYNLVITSVVAGDAGKYECQDDAGGGMKKSAHLVIIETDLMCQSNINAQKVIGPNSCDIQPDQLGLTCVVQYLGNEAPILQWRLNETNEPITNAVTRDTNGNRVTYNLTMTTEQISNGSYYVCQTTRSTSKISCNSGKIKVVGSTQGQEMSNGDSNCKPCGIAVICICLFLLLPLLICVIVLFLKQRCSWKPPIPEKLRCCYWTHNSESDKHQNDPTNAEAGETEAGCVKKSPPSDRTDQEGQEQSPGAAERRETYQKPTSAGDVKIPLLSDRSGESNSVLKSKIKALENEVNNLEQRIQRRDKIIKEENQTIDALKQNDASNKAENDQLRAKIKELEKQLYPKETIDYKSDLAYTIKLSEGSKGKSINGIAVLDKDLFVVTKCSQEIEVYDSKTFQHQRNMKVSEITDPMDIASSKDANCLYIVGRFSEETEKSKVVRLDLEGNVLNQWSTDGVKGRLSTYGSNAILCLLDKQLIIEYSPDGASIITVRLSPAANLKNPLHAIKVTGECFVVSHGDFKDKLHRVCVVDLDGNIKKECNKWEKSIFAPNACTTMKVPICLLEDNERSVIVADRNNDRILLLSSMLKYKRRLVEGQQMLKGSPVRLCFDDAQSKLFVAVNEWSSSKKEWKDGHILIFNIK